MPSLAGMTPTGILGPTLIRTMLGICTDVLYVMCMMQLLSVQLNTFAKAV